MRIAWALLLIVATIPALAEEPPLPRDRPAPSAESSVSAPQPAPPPPPSAASEAPAASSSAETSASSAEAPSSSAEPSSSSASSAEPSASSSTPPEKPAPPPRDYQVACPAAMSGQVEAKSMPPIHAGQCGIQSPLALSAIGINGRSVPLSSTVTTDCGMATALPAWLAEVDSYAFATAKTRIARVLVSTNYECRNVNHATTGNLSFHAFADAIDIMGLELDDGRTVSIAPGFNGSPEQGSTLLHFARDSACSHFMTVLGPDADSAHQDNMHLDLACHGKSCTTRLCQ